MARTDLAKSLSDLVKAIERAPDPSQPKPLTIVTTPVRDPETHRLAHTDIVRSDGKRWRKTPVRDEEHRIVRSVTVELPEEGA